MAEILLSLTIIGVVAAITLPSLTGNINERTWNTQRKALYARMSQALALMPNLNGYGKYDGTYGSGSVTVTEDTAAETFVTDGLSKVLKINNVCDGDHLQDCGIVSSYTNLAAVSKAFPTKLSELNSLFNTSLPSSEATGGYYQNPQKDVDTKAAAFETQNGESIAVFYNPHCLGDLGETTNYYAQPKMCANFIYDLNGSKGPNTVGKDIGFITALYPTDPVVVAPVPSTRDISGATTQAEAGRACIDADSETRVPNREELMSMFYNKELIGIESGTYWSGSRSSITDLDSGWRIHFHAAIVYPHGQVSNRLVRCVKR